ncbi:hypothetical protein ACJJTC_014489 [Scirpophaga incertulas]
MILLRLKLCILLFFYDSCAENEINLIASRNVRHQHKNFLLETVLKRMGYEVDVHNVNVSDFGTTVRYSTETRNARVINLEAFCDAHGYVLFTNSMLYIIEDNRNLCNNSKHILVSEDLFKNDAIRNVLETKNFEIPDKVLLCLPKNLPKWSQITEQFNDIHLIVEDDCNTITIDDSIIAILTDAPFRSETRLPVIFYHTPYLAVEYKDSFPISIQLWSEWKPLVYAFKYFLDSMKWRRVAVISDDSDYSLNFLQELLLLLDMEGFVYSSQMCVGIYCNFSHALQTLEDANAVIVIINVDTIHAEKLVHMIPYYSLNHVTWIVRDWPFPRNMKFQGMTEIFSITLSPKFTKHPQADERYVYANCVRRGLSLIRNAYKKVHGDRKKIQRYIADYPNNYGIYRHHAYVMRTDTSGRFTTAAVMRINGSHVDRVLNNPATYIKPDVLDMCPIRNNDYFNPCGTEEIMWIMAIVIMFIFMIPVIIVYFCNCQESPYERIF